MTPTYSFTLRHGGGLLGQDFPGTSLVVCPDPMSPYRVADGTELVLTTICLP